MLERLSFELSSSTKAKVLQHFFVRELLTEILHIRK